MSKSVTPRRLADNQALAKASHMRTSTQKLGLVAGLIRGKDVSKALAQLEFSRRRISNEVKKVLESAIANAENNHQLDVDTLYVKEVLVGKSLVMKRFCPRAKGRASKIIKPFSNMTIIVEERQEI